MNSTSVQPERRGNGRNAATVTPEQVRLASIADRHLAKLTRLPLNDRTTVATTILGSVLMEHPESERIQLLEFLIAAVLVHLEEEVAGR